MSRIDRSLAWSALWNPASPCGGLEHLIVHDTRADSVQVGIDEDGEPFRLVYQLSWTPQWALRTASLQSCKAGRELALSFTCDGRGRWVDATGAARDELDGCLDIDIWPSPFTNAFPIRRSNLSVGMRRELDVVWVDGLSMTFKRQRQAYERLAHDRYRFDVLDGGGFSADISVDDDGFVLDYPGLFRRVAAAPIGQR